MQAIADAVLTSAFAATLWFIFMNVATVYSSTIHHHLTPDGSGAKVRPQRGTCLFAATAEQFVNCTGAGNRQPLSLLFRVRGDSMWSIITDGSPGTN
jgi:hypothetical protein